MSRSAGSEVGRTVYSCEVSDTSRWVQRDGGDEKKLHKKMGFKQLLLLAWHFQVSSVWLYLEWCGQGSQMIHFNPCLLLCSTCSQIPSGTWASCSCVSVGKRLCGPLMFPNHTLSLDRLDGLAAVALMWPHQGSFISHVCLWSYAIAFVLAWRSIPMFFLFQP